MAKEYVNLELTSKVIKAVVNEIISPEIVHNVIKMREKLERADILIGVLDRGNVDFCDVCYDVMRDKYRKMCDKCFKWNCPRCISAEELSPIYHTCGRCGDNLCIGCIEDSGPPDICVTCESYYCKKCYEHHINTHD